MSKEADNSTVQCVRVFVLCYVVCRTCVQYTVFCRGQTIAGLGTLPQGGGLEWQWARSMLVAEGSMFQIVSAGSRSILKNVPYSLTSRGTMTSAKEFCHQGAVFSLLFVGYCGKNVMSLAHGRTVRICKIIGFFSLLSTPTSVADPDPFYTDTDPDPAFHFDTDPDPAFQLYTDPDPYHFKEVMYLNQYFLHTFT